MRNEELHNLLSTQIMIVLIRAIKQENEICDVCGKRGRIANFRTVHGWKTITKWLINEEELKELELINQAQGMTAVGLSWTPLIGRFGYTKLERFLGLLSNC